MGLGNPVLPDVCKKQNGSSLASSKLLVYGKASVDSVSRSSRSMGSCKDVIGRFWRTSLTKGTGEASTALTQILQFVAVRTARTPSVLFFGDKNKAYQEEEEEEE